MKALGVLLRTWKEKKQKVLLFSYSTQVGLTAGWVEWVAVGVWLRGGLGWGVGQGGIVWCDVVWPGLAWPGLAWCGVV